MKSFMEKLLNISIPSLVELFLSWISLSLTLYFFAFQPFNTISRKWLLISIFTAAILIILLSTMFKHESPQPPRFSLLKGTIISIALTIFVFLAKPNPSKAFVALPDQIHIIFVPQSPNASSLDVIWLRNGITDVSFQQIEWEGEAHILPDRIKLVSHDNRPIGLIWKGKAWKFLEIVLTGNGEWTAYIYTNYINSTETFEIARSGTKILNIPAGNHLLYNLITAGIWLNVFFTGLLLYIVIVRQPSLQMHLLTIPSQWMNTLPWIALAVFLILNWSIAISAGQFRRLYADDYCYLNTLHKFGWWGAISWSFHNLNGRFSSHFLNYTSFLLETKIIPLGVPLFLLLFGTSGYLLLHTIFPSSKPWKLLVISTSLPLFGLISFPDPVQSIYWTLHAIIVCGGFSLMLLTIRKTFIVMNKFSMKQAFILFFLALVSGGFHEAISIGGILFMGMLVWLEWRSKYNQALKRSPIPISLISFLGLTLGFIILITSPGNTNRVSVLGINPKADKVLFTGAELILQNFNWLFGGPEKNGLPLLILGIIFLIGLVFGMGNQPVLPPITRSKWEKWLILTYPILATLAIFFPSAFLSGYFPLRSLFVPQMIIILSVFWQSIWLARWLIRKEYKANLSFHLLVTGIIIISGYVSLPYFYRIHQQMHLHAQEWDTRQILISEALSQGSQKIIVPAFQHMYWTEVDLQPNPTNWLNQCIKEYYGVPIYAEDEIGK